jgi:hypothetical protein
MNLQQRAVNGEWLSRGITVATLVDRVGIASRLLEPLVQSPGRYELFSGAAPEHVRR